MIIPGLIKKRLYEYLQGYLHIEHVRMHIVYKNKAAYRGIDMENLTEGNRAHLAGRVISGPVFNHKTYGEAFYLVKLGIVRKSGYEDIIRLIISDRIMGGRSPRRGELIEICGQVRTYNREENGKNHLEITVFVREMRYRHKADFDFVNEISLDGFVCKEPIRRTSPLGREICDIMIAVNRKYNKSDYIPSIAWGRNAVYAERISVGERLKMEGRLQSREYRKYNEAGEMMIKTAYEMSISRMEVV